MNALPGEAGSYALVMRLAETVVLQIGSLGPVCFEPGIYVYTGSALGPGGLKARISHHLKITEQPRWHIDWLRPAVTLLAVGWKREAETRLECIWADRLRCYPDAIIPLKGFGASDCRRGCAAHLIHLRDGVSVEAALAWLEIGAEGRSLAGAEILG